MSASRPTARLSASTTTPRRGCSAASGPSRRCALSYNYPDLDAVPEGLVGRVHAKGVKICFRAGDTPEAVARMLALGLDYIPTNGMVPL